MREGNYQYPKSCLEVMFRGFESNGYSSGVYKIEPKPGKIVHTYCDFDRHGGGWTLVTKSSTNNGWNKDNVLSRNIDNPNSADFSIFEVIDDIKQSDIGEVSLGLHVHLLFFHVLIFSCTYIGVMV